MVFFILILVLTIVSQSIQKEDKASSLTSINENGEAECKLPAVPKHGSYSSPKCESEIGLPQCQKGGSHSKVPLFWLLAFTCDEGYRLPRNVDVYYTRCFNGVWAPVPPVCLGEKIISFIEKAYTPKATSKPIPGGCLLPRHPENGRYYAFSCTSGTQQHPGCQNIPGTPVPMAWTLTYTCDQGFVKQYSGGRLGQYARCTNGTWDVKPPMCTKTCPPLKSSTQEFRCFHGSSEMNCSQPSLPGTVASYRCHDLWTPDPRDTDKLLSCTTDGSWTRQPPPCQPICGVSKIDSNHPRIIDGDPSPLGNFPWHAGVYHKAANGQGWDQFCGGTLIKPNIILTAAFCVVKENQDRTSQTMAPKDLQVALGKYYRDWDKTELTEVKRSVKEVKVPSNYRGSSTNFESDIALLLLSEDVPMSNYVMAVCMEAPGIPQPANNMLGYITGWGNSEMVEPSPIVLYCSWPFQDYETCFHNIIKKNNGYITADKFCAGVEVRAAARKSVGGSFSFVVDNKHYISGILSSQVVRRDAIDYLRDINYPVFTNVSHPSHQQWVLTTVNEWVQPTITDPNILWLAS